MNIKDGLQANEYNRWKNQAKAGNYYSEAIALLFQVFF